MSRQTQGQVVGNESSLDNFFTGSLSFFGCDY